MSTALKLVKEHQSLDGVIDATIEISRRRADTLREIKKLLVAKRDLEALGLMRKYLEVEVSKA